MHYLILFIPVTFRHSSYFFFNDPATTEIYTLSLHDALPIFAHLDFSEHPPTSLIIIAKGLSRQKKPNSSGIVRHLFGRSEEHTSELQSLRHLVCRLLLEKKKTIEYSPVRLIAYCDALL